MGEALPSSIQAIVANRINNHDNSLRLIDRIKADHEEQRQKLKNRITSQRIYHEPTNPINKSATREWQHNNKHPQRKTEAAKSASTSVNRFSALEIEEVEEEPEEEEDECPPPTKTPTPFTHETKEAEDFLQQNYEYQRAIGIVSPIVKTALALKFVRSNELENWKMGLKQWINTLDIDTDDIPLVWDLFTKELKEQAQRNKDNATRQRLANLQMEEGQLKAYINEFESLAEQTGLTQANPTTAQTFIAGLTMPLQEQTTLQSVYGYCVARARAIQENQKQHAVAETLRARRQQRERLITLLQKRREPTQEEESLADLPAAPRKRPAAVDYLDQPKSKLTTITSDEPSTKRQRTTPAEIHNPNNADHIM
jgi:hypothetical protein